MLTPDRAEPRVDQSWPSSSRLVCFGHGAPLRDTAKFTAFCREL